MRNSTMQPKSILIALTLVFSLGLLATGASAEDPKPPETVTIDQCKTKKPAVVFPHKAHLAAFKKLGIEQKCTDCHHNKSKIGQACADCHKEKAHSDKVGLCTDASQKKNPFHLRCVGCHKDLAKNKPDVKTGPTKCNDCHKKS